MAKFNTIEQLKEWIEKNYNSEDVGGAWWETGNHDDSYEHGQTNGKTWTLYRIGTLIGMDLEMPEEIEPI